MPCCFLSPLTLTLTHMRGDNTSLRGNVVAVAISWSATRLLQLYVSFGSKRNVAKWIMNKKAMLFDLFISFFLLCAFKKKETEPKKEKSA